MQVLLKLTDKRPELVLDHFDKIKKATKESPSTISLAAQILSTAGKLNKVILMYFMWVSYSMWSVSFYVTLTMLQKYVKLFWWANN